MLKSVGGHLQAFCQVMSSSPSRNKKAPRTSRSHWSHMRKTTASKPCWHGGNLLHVTDICCHDDGTTGAPDQQWGIRVFKSWKSRDTMDRKPHRGTQSVVSFAKDFIGLEAAVKTGDRFNRQHLSKVKRLITDSCISCHRKHAETDHVFTQFYPVLRAVSPKK